MAFCGNCGAKLEDGVKFCSGCGTATPVQAQSNTAEQQAQQNVPPAQESVQQPYQQAPQSTGAQQDPKDVTHLYDPKDIETNKAMGILGYLIFFVPLLAAKDSPYAKFHANQGFGLFLGYIICSMLWIIPILGWIAAPICYIVLGVLSILGIINSIGGKAKKLPFVGKLNIFK